MSWEGEVLRSVSLCSGVVFVWLVVCLFSVLFLCFETMPLCDMVFVEYLEYLGHCYVALCLKM